MKPGIYRLGDVEHFVIKANETKVAVFEGFYKGYAVPIETFADATIVALLEDIEVVSKQTTGEISCIFRGNTIASGTYEGAKVTLRANVESWHLNISMVAALNHLGVLYV